MLPKIPLPGPGKTKKYLKHFCLDRPRTVYRGLGLLITFVVLAIVLGIILHDKLEFQGTEVATMVVAFGALVLGYQQWGEARHEASMEKYYERLDIANRRREVATHSVFEMMKSSIPELANEDPARLMYVYVELDNLEYVVGKYRLGFMSPGQACRGLRTFQRRCLSPEFRKIALLRVGAGDYGRDLIKVVQRVHEIMTEELDKLAE
ncbi:MAG: hypothetical protein QOF89_2536 [Acidobacteriota bacterium]|jgi:hypothetical protein|nr:hypothetical protein [Acidobacteriota bacterium]